MEENTITIDDLKKQIEELKSIQDMNKLLISLHPLDAYKVIRDIIKPKTNALILKAKIDDIESYKEFQAIQQEARNMFQTSQRKPNVGEVHEMISSMMQPMYNILVRMISKVDDELGRAELAINTLEERAGIDLTNFNVIAEEATNDTTRNDEQGEQKSPAGNGENS